jgi:rhodanese-related sulfurtransferase
MDQPNHRNKQRYDSVYKVKDFMMKPMNVKHMKIILSLIAVTAIILAGFFSNISAAETVPTSKIPNELIARKINKHDPSLAISVEAVLYKIRQSRQFTLVDVRSKPDFERLHIPGSINIPLYAVKTKTYLKSAPVVLVNEGFRYTDLQNECRRLAERGFKVSILDGGLPAWKRNGGQLVGDLFALEDMKAVSPLVFFREKNYENTLVVDISPARSEASSRLIPYASHIPVSDDNDASAAKFKKLITNNKPFQSIIIFNETGEQYERVEKIMNRMGIETFNLQGGVAGYQKYLEGLLLSWKPRDSRMKTVSNCKPCGDKTAEHIERNGFDFRKKN